MIALVFPRTTRQKNYYSTRRKSKNAFSVGKEVIAFFPFANGSYSTNDVRKVAVLCKKWNNLCTVLMFGHVLRLFIMISIRAVRNHSHTVILYPLLFPSENKVIKTVPYHRS